jgi:hypothetical protein
MTIKPVLVPDHDAADLRKLMNRFSTAAQSATPAAQANRIRQQLQESRPDVMRHAGDKTVKIVKRAGKPIGEIGTDAEASPGNGQYYVKLYDGSYDAVGFDTAEEALAELKAAIKQGVSEGMQTHRDYVKPDDPDVINMAKMAARGLLTYAAKTKMNPANLLKKDYYALAAMLEKTNPQLYSAIDDQLSDNDYNWLYFKAAALAANAAAKQGVAEGSDDQVIYKMSMSQYNSMSPEQRSAKNKELQLAKKKATQQLKGFTVVDSDKEQGVAEGSMYGDEEVSWEKGGRRAPTGAFRNPAVVKTNKSIGTRVSDIGAGGKEYNVKTDKEWDKQKGVAEAGHSDANRLEHRGTEYNVYFNTGKGRYIARGTGQMKGQIAPQWFRTLDDAQEHAEMEIGGYDDKGVTEATGDTSFDSMMGNIVKGARYKGAAADQRADAAYSGMMNNITKNAADVAKPSADSKFEQVYSAVERILLSNNVHWDIDDDISDALKKLKIKASDALMQKIERELTNRVSDALQYYDDGDLAEQGVSEDEVEEGWKQKVAGAALAGAAALGAGGAQAQTTDKFDPSWRTSGYDTSVRSDVSSTKSMNKADPSKDVNDFQKRIQSVTGPNAKGEYKVVVIQGNDIVSHYVTKTPPPGWLYKEEAEQPMDEGWKSKLAAAGLAGAAALGGYAAGSSGPGSGFSNTKGIDQFNKPTAAQVQPSQTRNTGSGFSNTKGIDQFNKPTAAQGQTLRTQADLDAYNKTRPPGTSKLVNLPKDFEEDIAESIDPVEQLRADILRFSR